MQLREKPLPLQVVGAFEEQIIANGKAKFVRREMGFNVLFFVMVITAISLADGRSRGVLLAIITVLPISFLGGYLRAILKRTSPEGAPNRLFRPSMSDNASY